MPLSDHYEAVIDQDALFRSLRSISEAVTPCKAPNSDAAGVHVGSLTEAVMGVTAGLCQIADALNNVAEAIREHGGAYE